MKNIGSLFYKPKRNEGDKPKRWNIFSIIGQALKRTCMAIGAMVLISTVISVIMVTKLAGNAAPPLPNEMVLVFKIDGGVTEVQTRPSLLEPFPFTQPTIRNVVQSLERAAEDDRVKALVVSLKSTAMSAAHVQELREAILKFRESGKQAKIYASSYDDPMGGLSQYYLASAFDEIWMQPVGMLSISGADMSMPFAKDALDKIGVQADFLKREKYKSAVENFTASKMSDENREMWNSILTDMSNHMMRDISTDRKIPALMIKRYVDQGILTGDEAVSAGLIDRLDYADIMVDELRKSIKGSVDDKSLELISLGRYTQGKALKKQPTPQPQKTDKVALIYAVGTIVDTAGAQGNAGADKISGAITKAGQDKEINAIVLRVDSPGGSPSASETIRRALIKAQEKGKNVVVSMGPVAASGGYWVSTNADQIVAMPTTITGSIGVVMGKFQAAALWKKLGINWQGPQIGKNADIWSVHKTFDEEGRERLNVLIDDVYNAFLTRVAEGRNMSIEEARNVAQGRAWTGEQAMERGLVDTMGGLNTALDETAKLLGKDNRDDLTVVVMPRELTKLEQFVEIFTPQVSLGKFLGIDSAFMKKMKALATQAEMNDNARQSSVYQAELEMFR